MNPTPATGRPGTLRLALLVPLFAIALWTLLASSTFEDEEEVPADVSWSLTTLLAPVVVDDGEFSTETINLRLAGEYSADAGDDLSIIRDGLVIDTTSALTVNATAQDPDDELDGEAALDVTFAIEIDLNQDPTSGQFSVLEGGTTTLVTVQDDGVDLEVGTGTVRSLSFEDFLDAASDTDEEPAIRFASVAYSELPRTLILARLAEDLLDDVDANTDMLESMNLNEPLVIDCTTSGTQTLRWTRDAPGAGQGSLGEGDSVESLYVNCFDRRIERYLDGTVVLDDYLPAVGPDRSLGGEFTYSSLYVAEDEIDRATIVPSPESPRVLSGQLQLRYDETVEDEPAPQ